jgi:hypothetical protein
MIVIKILTRFVAVCHVLKRGTTDSAVAQSDWSEFALGEEEVIIHCSKLFNVVQYCSMWFNVEREALNHTEQPIGLLNY